MDADGAFDPADTSWLVSGMDDGDSFGTCDGAGFKVMVGTVVVIADAFGKVAVAAAATATATAIVVRIARLLA